MVQYIKLVIIMQQQPEGVRELVSQETLLHPRETGQHRNNVTQEEEADAHSGVTTRSQLKGTTRNQLKGRTRSRLKRTTKSQLHATLNNGNLRTTSVAFTQ